MARDKQSKYEKITTIKLSNLTKNRIDNLKEYRRETYDEILEKMLEILNTCKADPEKAQSRLRAIDRRKIKQKRIQIRTSKPQAQTPARQINKS